MGGLRKSGGDGSLSASELQLRGQVYQDLRRTKRASMTVGRAGIKTAKFGMSSVAAMRKALVNRDSREMLKYFTEDEVKRWESLTVSQQRSILRKAESAVRNSENTLKNAIPGKSTIRQDVFNTTDGSAVANSIGSNGGNGFSYGYSPQRNSMMAKEANILAGEKLPYRFEVEALHGNTLQELRKSKKAGITDTYTYYAATEKKGIRKAVKMQKKYKTAERREAFRKAKLFHRQVSRDARREAQRNNMVREMRRQQKIDIARYETESNKAILSNATMPIRTVTKYGVKRVLRRIGAGLKKMVLALIPGFVKTALMAVGFGIVSIVILIGVIAMLVTGMGGNKRSLGTWRLTSYRDTPEDQGPYVGQTASGAPLVAGRTVAVSKATMDRLGLKFGDRLQLDDGRIFVIEDHGDSNMHNKLWMDIFCDTYEEAYSERNNRYAEVFLLDDDYNLGAWNLLGGGGNDITAFAEQYVGCPYVWGGSSLTQGCDCSHFVWLVLMNTGHYSGDYLTSFYWRTAGEAVPSLEMAQAGDIICYNGHVAIYDGNGLIIEAKGSNWGITHDRTADHAPILAIRRFT